MKKIKTGQKVHLPLFYGAELPKPADYYVRSCQFRKMHRKWKVWHCSATISVTVSKEVFLKQGNKGM